MRYRDRVAWRYARGQSSDLSRVAARWLSCRHRDECQLLPIGDQWACGHEMEREVGSKSIHRGERRERREKTESNILSLSSFLSAFSAFSAVNTLLTMSA